MLKWIPNCLLNDSSQANRCVKRGGGVCVCEGVLVCEKRQRVCGCGCMKGVGGVCVCVCVGVVLEQLVPRCVSVDTPYGTVY